MQLTTRQALYVSLLAISGLSFFGWIVLHGKVAFADAWLPNVGTEVAAIVFVALFVERIVERDRKRRLAPIQRIAAGCIERGLYHLSKAAVWDRGRDGAPVTPGLPLEQLFRDWANQVLEDGFQQLEPTAAVKAILQLQLVWKEVRDRFTAALEDELDLLRALDDYVAWVELNEDQFRHKLERWEGVQEALRTIDPALEEYAWGAHGDPRASLAEHVEGAVKRVARVLAEFEKASLGCPSVTAEFLEDVFMQSAVGKAIQLSERPPREFR